MAQSGSRSGADLGSWKRADLGSVWGQCAALCLAVGRLPCILEQVHAPTWCPALGAERADAGISEWKESLSNY